MALLPCRGSNLAKFVLIARACCCSLPADTTSVTLYVSCVRGPQVCSSIKPAEATQSSIYIFRSNKLHAGAAKGPLLSWSFRMKLQSEESSVVTPNVFWMRLQMQHNAEFKNLLDPLFSRHWQARHAGLDLSPRHAEMLAAQSLRPTKCRFGPDLQAIQESCRAFRACCHDHMKIGVIFWRPPALGGWSLP